MRLKIPMTGTVIKVDPELKKLDGHGIIGDDNDPVRPIDLNLGGVFWTLVGIDIDNEIMEIEVTPSDMINVPDLDANGKPKVDDEGNTIYLTRKTTVKEKATLLQYAQKLIESHTKDELYEMSKCDRLNKSEGYLDG